MDVANEIKFEFLQYCPSLFNQKAITNDFLIIYHDRLTRHNRTLKLDAFKANITDLNSCKMDDNSMIE